MPEYVHKGQSNARAGHTNITMIGNSRQPRENHSLQVEISTKGKKSMHELELSKTQNQSGEIM